MGMAAENAFQLSGRYILALPTEGVAGAVHKLVVAATDMTNQVARVEVDVTLGKHVAQQCGFGFFLLRVAHERRCLGDLSEKQPRLSVIGGDQVTIGIAHRLLGFLVILDQGDVAAAESDGVVHVKDIQKRHVAFAGGVELVNIVDREALAEFLPDRRPQPVADHHPDRVVGVIILRWPVEQITTQLADITETRAAIVMNILPEFAGTEAPTNDHGGRASDDGAPADQQASGVVERQREVEHVVRPHSRNDVSETRVSREPAFMIGDGCFGHPGGAGRIDVEQEVRLGDGGRCRRVLGA